MLVVFAAWDASLAERSTACTCYAHGLHDGTRRRVAVPTPKMVDPYIMRSRLDVERAAILGRAPVTLWPSERALWWLLT